MPVYFIGEDENGCSPIKIGVAKNMTCAFNGNCAPRESGCRLREVVTPTAPLLCPTHLCVGGWYRRGGGADQKA